MDLLSLLIGKKLGGGGGNTKRFNVPSLPSEYQEVEYLSTNEGATGHPYVRVDYSLKVGDCIECGFKGLHTILGPDNAWNFHINDNLTFSIYNNGGYTYGIGYQPYTDNAIGKFVLTFSAVGSQTYFNYGLWRSNDTYVYDGNLYPLYVYNQATFGVYENDNNSLIIALIPCYKKATNESGFYDVVNNVFLTAPSGRTFGRGADVN